MIAPSGNPITTPYGQVPGYPLNGGFHTGLDFSYSPDHTVYAPEAGNPRTVPWDGVNINGNAIELIVDNRRHYFSHLAKFLIASGQHVEAGQPIGIMGATGAAEGAHLHWALRVDGVLTDPLPYIGGKGAGDIIGLSMIIGSGDNWRNRFNKLHHQLVRNGDMAPEVFNSIVGADAWKVVESWSDHPEADQLTRWQELGQRADQEKWADTLTSLKAQIADLNAALKAGSIEEAKQIALTCQSELADAQAEKQRETEAGMSFFRKLGRLLGLIQ